MCTETACAAGDYSAPGAVVCVPCPAGSACLDPTVAPVQCLAGTYASVQSTTCDDCPTGNKCPADGLTAPVTCPAGSQQTITGQADCVGCTPGGLLLPFVTLCCLILPYVALCYLILPYLTLSYLMLPYIFLCYRMLHYVTLCYLMPCVHCNLLYAS